MACFNQLPEDLRPETLNSLYMMQPAHEEEVPAGNELSQLLASHFGDDRDAIR
jgi:hypothetical protein